MPGPMNIREAVERDLFPVWEIYNYYVSRSHSTFAEEPSPLEEWREKLDLYQTTGPHRLLVAEAEGSLLGFASSSPYRDHPAFQETVEFGVYLAPGARQRGVGSALYASLFQLLENEPVHLAVAGIALPNEASVRLHKKFGFTEVGVFQEYAKVHGRYYSSVWMQKLLVR
jgi:phosphinothricin acetyltransferase